MRVYDLEPLVRGNSYPAWDLDAALNEVPMGMDRVELLVRDSGNQIVYSWDSAGETPNVVIEGGIATFAEIPAEVTQSFRVGRHNHELAITYGGLRLSYFRGTWQVQESVFQTLS